jgi:hypothetical protein
VTSITGVNDGNYSSFGGAIWAELSGGPEPVKIFAVHEFWPCSGTSTPVPRKDKLRGPERVLSRM